MHNPPPTHARSPHPSVFLLLNLPRGLTGGYITVCAAVSGDQGWPARADGGFHRRRQPLAESVEDRLGATSRRWADVGGSPPTIATGHYGKSY